MDTVRFVFRERRTYRRVRRLVHAALAAVALVAAAPVLIAAGIAIALDDGFPLLFRQQRVGRFGRIFTMYKLRTMKRSACCDALSPSATRDPRVTRIGEWLRRTSIDELPQLINVLRGDMALVGPRPEMPMVVRTYQPWQHLRHLAEPGITCIWQTACRSTIPLARPEATQMDLEYIRRASALTDSVLLARTIAVVISMRGAY